MELDIWRKFAIKLLQAQNYLYPGTRFHEWAPGVLLAPVPDIQDYRWAAIETVPAKGSMWNICVLEITPENMEKMLSIMPEKSRAVFEYRP